MLVSGEDELAGASPLWGGVEIACHQELKKGATLPLTLLPAILVARIALIEG